MNKIKHIKKRSAEVKALFERLAGQYDFVNNILSCGQDKHWRNLTAKRSDLTTGAKGLDLCCGTALLTIALASLVGSSGEITGVDFSPNMLAIARKNIARANPPARINLVQAEVTALPFEDNSYDGVTIGWGLRNVPDLEATVREMARVVRPGGKVVSLDMGQPQLPLLKQLYWLFFGLLVPRLGKLLTKDESAYRYLFTSSKYFLDQQQLGNIFARSGLQDIRITNLCGGALAIVEGRKGLA